MNTKNENRSMIKWETINKANENMKRVPIKGKKYAQVNDRVLAFRSFCPNGSIESDVISLDGSMVVIKATVRDEDGRVLATGIAYEKEGSSNINKTSFVENCETSAVGRALGFLGLGAEDSIATAEELANAVMQQGEMKMKENTSSRITDQEVHVLKNMFKPNQLEAIMAQCGITRLEDMTGEQYANVFRSLNEKEKKDAKQSKAS